ncbi:calcium-binding protein [Azospirillum sp. Vi22]|nr:calcium-binding protein [Azospirillum baldaniorum]
MEYCEMATWVDTAGTNYWEGPFGQSNSAFGLAGNDTIFTGNLDDYASGGEGNDYIIGEAGNDDLYGDNGNDTLGGGDGNDFLDGGNGHDYLVGGNGNDELFGGDGNDSIGGDAGNDLLNGGNGDDLLVGGLGNDTMNGGAGTDTLLGGDGDDVYQHDWLQGGTTYIQDSSGSGDTLVFSNASLNDLVWGVTDNGYDLYILHASDAADGIMDHGVYIDNYFTYGGEIEWLTAGNQTVNLWGWLTS